MKKVFTGLAWGMIIIFSPSPSVGGEEDRAEIAVEGVAAGRQAAPVAALREIGERINGLPFSLYDGKYIQLGEDAPALPLDTQDKKTVEIRELKSGLFKAVLKIEFSAARLEAARELRVRTVWGEGELKPGGSILVARGRARDDALKKAILTAAEEQFPGDSTPHHLSGRVYFLGTVEEKVEAGLYLLVARIKVFLTRA